MQRLLLVEDDPGVSRVLALVLERAGFLVTTASNGGEALARLAAANGDPVSAVVLDLRLPDGKGGDVLHRLQHPKSWQAAITAWAAISSLSQEDVGGQYGPLEGRFLASLSTRGVW